MGRLPTKAFRPDSRTSATVPAVDLIVTTARLGRLFAEVGRPVTDGMVPPTPEEMANFVAVSQKYGYRLGTAEENAAVGLQAPIVGT